VLSTLRRLHVLDAAHPMLGAGSMLATITPPTHSMTCERVRRSLIVVVDIRGLTFAAQKAVWMRPLEERT
jgi:hypothetical protein